jgi:transcriptional regulator with XRE-family HTH domain
MAKNLSKIAQIRKALNLTQDEMAMLFHISRPQWAYYELGKRDLPTAAFERLAVIEILLASPEINDAKEMEPIEIQKHQINEMLEDALKDNEYHQEKLERMITSMEEKKEASQKMLKLISTLEHTELKEPLHPSVLPILKKQAIKTLEQNNALDLLKLKIRLHSIKQVGLFISSLLPKE